VKPRSQERLAWLAFLRSIKGDPKFSPNLYAWVRRSARRFPSVPPAALKVWRMTGGRGPYYHFIGYESDGDVMGNRLSEILARYGRTEIGCYPGLARNAKEVRTWWPRYLKLGRCAIDPKHQVGWVDRRWDEKGAKRTCRWCGRHTQTRVTRVVRQTVTEWVSSGKRAA
jgi:hypothetical protein